MSDYSQAIEATRKQREGKVLSFPEKVALRKFNQEVAEGIRLQENEDGGANGD